ncbi:MAG: Hint domain-containing protein [Sulfitobacter sp.]
MAFLYVYSPSDFVEGLPDEVGAQADGVPTFTLTLVAGAVPTLIEVNDDDLIFDEVDGSQTLTTAATIESTTYAAGTTINTAYDLINSATGHKLTSFHFGGDGYQQGAVAGVASTQALVPGTAYTFNVERTSHNQNNLYDDYVACFTSGTRIETRRGQVEVQDLQAGDLIRTADHGFQPVRLVLQRHLTAGELHAKPNLRPVCLRKGALGLGLPKRDLMVSPQHRFLANSPIVERMFGAEEVLVSAKKISGLPGIFSVDDIHDVTYFHLVMDCHEVVFAECAPTESFYCGPMAIAGLADAAQAELLELFPQLKQENHIPKGARNIPANKRQTRFAMRHERNGKTVLSQAA